MKADLHGTYEIIYSNLRETPEQVSGSVSLEAGESVVLKKVQ